MRKFFGYLLLVIVLLALPLGFVRQARSFAVRQVAPLSTVLVHGNNRLSAFLSSIGDISTLRSQRSDLQRQVVDLQQQLITFEDLTRENEALRKEAGVTGTTRTYPKVLGHVVLRGSDAFDRTVTLDVGEREGIKEGQPAVYQGALVGRVLSVRPTSSVVRLLTSRNSSVQVWISESREKGLLVGDGSTVFLSDITQGLAVPDKSVVETSGLGGSLPQGILVGQTGVATSKKSDDSQRFIVDLGQDPGSAESLFILLTESQ